MRKIMFNDTYGLTRLVLDGTKIQTRRRYPSHAHSTYNILETVAIAQSYRTIASNTNLDYETRIEATRHQMTAGWNNKMFTKSELMPYRIIILDRWAEHITDISQADCLNEGIMRGALGYFFPNHPFHYQTPYDAYKQLIIQLFGKRYWDDNPKVIVYQFKVVKADN